MVSQDISKYPVMKAKSKTCPFGENGNREVRANVETRLLDTSLICHHPALKDKPLTHLCRGARDFQITILYRIGFLEAPTDEAWNKKLVEVMSRVKSK